MSILLGARALGGKVAQIFARNRARAVRNIPQITGAVGAAGGLPALQGAAGALRRVLPGAGLVGGGAALGGLAGRFAGAPRRRRRSRGLTGAELRGFRRTAKLIKDYCPTVRKIPRAALGGRKSCR